MQVLCLFRLMKDAEVSGDCPRTWKCFTLLTFVFIVLWQFSPFLLLLQAASLYFVYLVCGYRSLRPVVNGVVNAYIVAMLLAIIVHFGSPYLLTSPFLFELVGQ